jgi:hypothetical protein
VHFSFFPISYFIYYNIVLVKVFTPRNSGLRTYVLRLLLLFQRKDNERFLKNQPMWSILMLQEAFRGGAIIMSAVQAYYNGSAFVPLAPVKAQLNQPALITILEVATTNSDSKRLSQFFGALSVESYSEILDALKDTERVDIDEW